jgi:hypothetical protein
MQTLINCGFVSNELISIWKSELTNLVEFSTVKFVGFSKQESVEEGLAIILSSASLALMEKSNGVYDPLTWGSTMFSLGLHGLVRYAVELVKKLVSLPSVAQFYCENDFEMSPRNMLVLLAQKTERGLWVGYDYYRSDFACRKFARDMVELGKVVVRRVYPNRPFRLTFPPDDPMVPLADQVVNTICLRMSLGWKIGIVLSIDEARRASKALQLAQPKDIKVMEERFHGFVESLPEHLRYLFLYNNVSWFTGYIVNFRNTKKRMVIDGNAYHVSMAL